MSLTCERLGNRGSVGVLSIIVMLVLSLLGAAFIAITATEVNTSANYRDGVAAQYLAEAGANRGIAELMANPDWTGNADQYNLGRGFYRVQAAAAGNNRTITATGVVGNATRSVVVRVTLGTSATNVYAYPLFSSGNLNIDNNAQANGSVRSNATINVNNNARVSQDVIAHGSVNIGNNAVIGGKETEGAAVLTVPAYERSDYSG
ncbi:MAG: pilus assembly PilX N-terminal domain-containing protein, partial [Negativicutes bacterium]|nr:pilus assembly PilX N-terminal domain-containing protein [Negativicutes bacterium]